MTMKPDKTELIIVLDRSGSMSSIKKDMEGGLKSLIEKQAAEPGECLVSVYQFDDRYEPVFEVVNAKKAPQITLTPRGSTALRDALGKTINAVGERLAKTLESDRPGLVILAVITDGFENASKEFTQPQVADLVKHQREKYGWQFVFLGAEQDAVLSGGNYGVAAGASMTYTKGARAVGATYGLLSSKIVMMRSDVNQFGKLDKISDTNLFDEADRAAAVTDKP